MSAAAVYRQAVLADLPACTRVWRAGLADYLGRLNADDGLPVELEPLRRMLAHFLSTDPGRFWVAVQDPGPGERIVGFGSAHIRGGTWFLSMLFVEPRDQRSGIGRTLFERTLAGADGLTRGTATDSAQPISNALYARFGIVPRMPCLNMVGRPFAIDELPGLPAGVEAVPFASIVGAAHAGLHNGEGGAADRDPATNAGPVTNGHATLVDDVGAIDRALLGYERPQDHRWLRAEGRFGFLYRNAAGSSIGYGYVSPVGRIGPVAALDPDLLWPITAHLLAAHEPAGASSLWVPGHAGDVVAGLIRAGLRLEAFPALMCWSSPIAPFDRYLPINLALI